MKRYLTFICILSVFSTVLNASNDTDWAETFITAKEEVLRKQKEANMPRISDKVTYKDNLHEFSWDISDIDTLTMILRPVRNYINFNLECNPVSRYASWLNPRLTDKEGNQIWMDDMELRTTRPEMGTVCAKYASNGYFTV